jgi:MFS family permease
MYRGSWRWILLLLACTGEIGGYYAMDIPSALKQPLINDMNLSEVQFNLLYSIDALPNIILPFVAGLLVDRYLSR